LSAPSTHRLAPPSHARLAGVAYLAVFVAGFVYVTTIPKIGLTGNNVEAAVNHIAAHRNAFWIGYAAFLVSIAFRLMLMLLFYELFKPVDKRVSQLAVYFNITATSVQATMAVLLLLPLAVLTGSHHYLASFTPDQLRGLAAIALRLNYYGYTTALVFFAGYDLMIGYLAFRSTFIPRQVGVLMMVTGLGWLTYLAPDAAARLLPFNLLAGGLGEVAMILWLLIRGVDEDRWMDLAGLGRSPQTADHL
jgi:hypothetical protein